MIRIAFALLLCALALPAGAALAAPEGALFDIEKRRQQLQTPEYAQLRAYCMGQDADPPPEAMPPPFPALKATEAYGTDDAMEDFSYYLMFHSGRALAGDHASQQRVKTALLSWAKADALEQTEESHDTYYALKRGLLPVIVSYEILRPQMTESERTTAQAWIDPLVRRIDKMFGKEVDRNNHRYLADAVLTLWGDVIGDPALYAKGKERFAAALSDMTAEGALPLEARRGARALWYARQSLANLTMIASIYHRNGESLYTHTQREATLARLMHHFVTGVRYPFTVLASASQNHIPGPSKNFLEQDMGMLDRRGHGRHYMAFAHMYLAHAPENDASRRRLEALMQDEVFDELPLIDEFAGGNATCFWGMP